jgi:hypothetical protein
MNTAPTLLPVRRLLAVLPLFLLAGCGSWFMSPEAKINAAIPPTAEVQTFQRLAVERVQSDSRSELAQQIENKFKLRALSCAKEYSPSWSTSADAIRKQLVDRSCFTHFDEELAQWLRTRYVGLILADGPLRKIPATPIPMLSVAGHIINVVFARNAGVVVATQEGKFQVLDMNDGQSLVEHPVRMPQGVISLSPNGRLLLLRRAPDSVGIMSVESGEELLQIQTPYGLHWLSDRFAVYSSIRTGPRLIDFHSGHTADLPAMEGELMWVTAAPDTGDEFILVFSRSFARIQVLPDIGGLSVKVLRTGASQSPLNYTEMSGMTVDGSTLYQVGTSSLGLVSPTTFEQESVDFSPWQLPFAQPLDGDRILIKTGMFLPGAYKQGNVVFAIKARSVAAVRSMELERAQARFVPSVQRIAYIDGTKLIFVEHVDTESPVSVSEYIQGAVAAANQAKLAAAVRAEAAGLAGSAVTTMVVGAAPPLAAFVDGADIEAIGVYEGNNAKDPQRQRVVGDVSIHVVWTARPLVLVLAAYEAVQWKLELEPGARLVAVLLSGYGQSTVSGAGNARVLVIGEKSAYQAPSTEFTALHAEVVKQTGQRIGVFQGRYAGGSYSVGKKR